MSPSYSADDPETASVFVTIRSNLETTPWSLGFGVAYWLHIHDASRVSPLAKQVVESLSA